MAVGPVLDDCEAVVDKFELVCGVEVAIGSVVMGFGVVITGWAWESFGKLAWDDWEMAG